MSVEFRCGKMKVDGNGTTVRSDTRKGKLNVKKSDEDGLLHLTWTDRSRGLVEDDFIIFPGDASFLYVDAAKDNTKNNRVYVLKFTSTKKCHFFWMQEPKADKDEELCKKVHAAINGEADSMGGGENVGAMDQAQLLSMLTQGQHRPEAAATAAADESTEDATDSQPGGPGAAAGAGAAAGDAAGQGDAAAVSSEGDKGGDKMDVDESSRGPGDAPPP